MTHYGFGGFMTPELASTFLDSDATKYGINEAIILFKVRNFLSWAKSQKSKKHCHQGRWWTYSSYAGWQELMPYFSHRQIRYAIQNLIKKGVLLTGNFNKKRYDKTTWYSVNESSFEVEKIEFQQSETTKIGTTYDKFGTTYAKNGKPIPNYSPNNSLSLSISLSNEFEDSFGRTLRQKDRERIFKIIENRKQFSQSDINEVFLDVFKNKTDALGRPINSEIGYLEVCFEKHLTYLTTKKAKESESIQKMEALIQRESQESLEKSQDESRFEYIERLFEENFRTSEERDSIIKKYSESLNKYSSGIGSILSEIGPAVRSYALEQWYSLSYAPLVN